MARPKKKRPVSQPTCGSAPRGKPFVPPATITLPAMLQSGRDLAFRETLYLMVLAFGRIQPCREGFGQSLGAHRFAVHRADRNRLPARQRGRLDPRARRPHPARRNARDHRGRPADRQGSAHQAGQHARPPQRAGAADRRRARMRSARSIRCCAASTTCCFRRVARGLRRGVALPRKVRAQQRICARGNPPLRARTLAAERAQGRIETTALPLPPAARSITLPGIVTRGT